MNLNERPRTGVDFPEVDSYLHESAARACRAGCAGTIDVRGFPTDVFPLIDADVGYDRKLVAGVVPRRTARVSHGCDAAKIGDTVRVRIYGIKWGRLVGRAGKELIVKAVRWNYVSTRQRNRLNFGYRIDLGFQGNTEGQKNKRQVPEPRSHFLLASWDRCDSEDSVKSLLSRDPPDFSVEGQSMKDNFFVTNISRPKRLKILVMPAEAC
jgi:hypothetical protein